MTSLEEALKLLYHKRSLERVRARECVCTMVLLIRCVYAYVYYGYTSMFVGNTHITMAKTLNAECFD